MRYSLLFLLLLVGCEPLKSSPECNCSFNKTGYIAIQVECKYTDEHGYITINRDVCLKKERKIQENGLVFKIQRPSKKLRYFIISYNENRYYTLEYQDNLNSISFTDLSLGSIITLSKNSKIKIEERQMSLSNESQSDIEFITKELFKIINN